MRKKMLFPALLAVMLVLQLAVPMSGHATEGEGTKAEPARVETSQTAVASKAETRSGVKISEQFPDPALAQAIADKLKVTVDDVMTPEQISGVTFLSLYGKGIKSLDGIEIFTNLSSLVAGHNDITKWPDVSKFPKLMRLHLNSNKNLTGFPEAVTELENLQYLNLNLTDLGVDIPASIGNVTSLKELNLINANVFSLPDTIGNLTNLETLYAYGNSLKSLPDSIVNLKNLKTISFGYNNINTMSKEQYDFIKGVQEDRLEAQVTETKWDTIAYTGQDYPLTELFQIEKGWLDGLYAGTAAPVASILTPENYQKFINGEEYDATPITLEKNDTGEYYIPGDQIPEAGDYIFRLLIRGSATVDGAKSEFVFSRVGSAFTVKTMYKVNYDSMGGSPVEGVSAPDGSLISQPTAPVKEGFSFKGWYKSADFATPWDFDKDVVTGDMTLYAKWEEVSASEEEVSPTPGEITTPSKDPAKSGTVRPVAKSKAVKTGDDSQMGILMGIMGMGALALAGLGLTRRKKTDC